MTSVGCSLFMCFTWSCLSTAKYSSPNTAQNNSNIFSLNYLQLITEGHGGHSQEHLERVHEGNEGEEENWGESIVGLVVDQIADNSISEFVNILVFRDLEPGTRLRFNFAQNMHQFQPWLWENEVIEASQRCQFCFCIRIHFLVDKTRPLVSLGREIPKYFFKIWMKYVDWSMSC